MHELLQADAGRWQTTVDSGACESHATQRPRRSARRPALAVLGSVAAVAIAAIAVATLDPRHDGDHSSPGSGQAASMLQNLSWNDPAARSSVTFTENTVTIDDGCHYVRRDTRITERTVIIGKQRGSSGVCSGTSRPAAGPARDAADRREAAAARVVRVLNGTLSWTLSGATLHLAGAAGDLVLQHSLIVTPRGRLIPASLRLPAVPFTLPLLGRSGDYTLADHRGRVVVIHFSASWCGPCRAGYTAGRQPPALQSATTDVLTIDTRDTRGNATAFFAPDRARTPVAFDPQGTTLEALVELTRQGRTTLPTALPLTVVIDRHQRIAAVYTSAMTNAALADIISELDD